MSSFLSLSGVSYCPCGFRLCSHLPLTEDGGVKFCLNSFHFQTCSVACIHWSCDRDLSGFHFWLLWCCWEHQRTSFCSNVFSVFLSCAWDMLGSSPQWLHHFTSPPAECVCGSNFSTQSPALPFSFLQVEGHQWVWKAISPWLWLALMPWQSCRTFLTTSMCSSEKMFFPILSPLCNGVFDFLLLSCECSLMCQILICTGSVICTISPHISAGFSFSP